MIHTELQSLTVRVVLGDSVIPEQDLLTATKKHLKVMSKKVVPQDSVFLDMLD